MDSSKISEVKKLGCDIECFRRKFLDNTATISSEIHSYLLQNV